MYIIGISVKNHKKIQYADLGEMNCALVPSYELAQSATRKRNSFLQDADRY